MKIVIRADVSRALGCESMLRCMGLALALRERGCSVLFLSRAREGHALSVIGQNGFDCKTWSAEEKVPQCDWLVVDQYDLDIAWESAQRGQARRVMVIDSLANRAHDCDLLLDPGLVPQGLERHAPWLPLDCPQIIGPHFAPLWPDFAVQRARKPVRSGRVRRLLLGFGAHDEANFCGRFVALLAETLPELSLDVVLPQGAVHWEAVRAACARHPQASVASSYDNLAVRIRKADLFVGDSAWCWERAALGLPAITLALQAYQLAAQSELAMRSAGIDLGLAQEVLPLALEARIRQLMDNALLMQDMSWRLMAFGDGGGAQRVVQRMLS